MTAGPSVGQIGLARQAVEFVWRQHFKIPEPVYWVALVVSAIGFSAASPLEAIAWTGLILLSVAGIARWRWHRRRSRALVVARFSAVSGHEGMAARVQELCMTSLQDKLPSDLLQLVHSVPAVVGPADQSYAVRLRRRLRGTYLVHGRVDERPGGGWAVFARVVQPADRDVVHVDWFTRDITPARARWSHLFELLTPSKEVVVEEYPLEFSNELEAIVRGLAGQVAAAFEDDERAERLLRTAISKAPGSTSHQIDQLRIALARVLDRADRRAEALALLRERARNENPSPALLRELGLLSFGVGREATLGDPDPTEAQEAIAALRRAAEYDADPQRDLTLYNLALMVWNDGGDAGREEGEQIIAELLRTSSFYRRAWYVHFHHGAAHYHLALKAQEEGDEESARRHFKRAARHYSRGIRLRPRFRFFWPEGPTISFLHRFRRVPILYANAKDAHQGAGHRIRAWWYERRFEQRRRKLMKIADKAFGRGEWDRAYAYYDWAIVGRWDEDEVLVRTIKAVVTRQCGEDEQAETEWAETLEAAPGALLMRAVVASQPVLERGVPGSEPTDMPTVVARLKATGLVDKDAPDPPS